MTAIAPPMAVAGAHIVSSDLIINEILFAANV
jgi:hypothetical protein